MKVSLLHLPSLQRTKPYHLPLRLLFLFSAVYLHNREPETKSTTSPQQVAETTNGQTAWTPCRDSYVTYSIYHRSIHHVKHAGEHHQRLWSFCQKGNAKTDSWEIWEKTAIFLRVVHSLRKIIKITWLVGWTPMCECVFVWLVWDVIECVFESHLWNFGDQTISTSSEYIFGKRHDGHRYEVRDMWSAGANAKRIQCLYMLVANLKVDLLQILLVYLKSQSKLPGWINFQM